MNNFGGYKSNAGLLTGIVNAFLITFAGIAAWWLLWLCGVGR